MYYYQRKKSNSNILGIDINKYISSAKKSINKPRCAVIKSEKRKLSKDSFKKRMITAGSVFAAFSLGVGAGSIGTKLVERAEVIDSLKEEKESYTSLVSENTRDAGINNNGEHMYYYDTDDMALTVSCLESDFEIEKAAYGIYSNMKANKKDNFNSFLKDLSSYVDEASYFYSLSVPNALEKYQVDKGFSLNDDLGYEKYIIELKEHENIKTGGRTI